MNVLRCDRYFFTVEPGIISSLQAQYLEYSSKEKERYDQGLRCERCERNEMTKEIQFYWILMILVVDQDPAKRQPADSSPAMSQHRVLAM